MMSLHKECTNNLVTLRIYWELFRGYGYGKWGITIDGFNPDISSYIDRRVKNKVKAVMVVRDPISILITAINHSVYVDVLKQKAININSYLSATNNDDFLQKTICFDSNLNMVKDKITNIYYIDTTMLKSNVAENTMNNICNFLELIPPRDNSVFINVNDTFTRAFPYIFYIDGYEFIASPFNGDFSVLELENNIYNKQDTRFYISKNYVPKKFKDRKLNISSDKHVNINNELLNKIYGRIEKYLEKIEVTNSLYEKYKIDYPILLKYLMHNPDTFNKVKNTIEKETKIIKDNASHIFENWVQCRHFLELDIDHQEDKNSSKADKGKTIWNAIR